MRLSHKLKMPDRCCNPLGEKSKHSSQLRSVPQSVKRFFPNLDDGAKICDSCRKKLIFDNQIEINDYFEIVRNLHDKLQDESLSRDKKSLLIGLLPKSWSERRTAAFANASRRLAKSSKESGESFKIEKRGRKSLTFEICESVKLFYQSDENSRIMPGLRDTKCIKNEDGSKEYIQKRLILYNLRELYLKYKEEHPEIGVGFSKFAELRPKNCVLAGASGTHTVCVCVHHQNVKLMLSGVDISKVTLGQINDYKGCIAAIVCKETTPQCYLNTCENCPGVEPLKSKLYKFFEKASIDEIKSQRWHNTDRSTLETRTVSREMYINNFAVLLLKLKTHSFISKQQSLHFKAVHDSLTEGEFLIALDFSENYAFIVQDAAQSFHYNNNQSTLATAVIYYKLMDSSDIQHSSIVVFSDCLTHDTAAVYCVQEKLYQHLHETFSIVKKIFYFTDGAAQHFKNKYNFENIRYHLNDFNIRVEWHFHATAHGKNACDGIGGSVKSNARRESLRKISSNQILTPQGLYEWARNYFKNIHCYFYSKEDYLANVKKLGARFKTAETVQGTLSYHSVSFIEESNQLAFRPFSASETMYLHPPRRTVPEKNNNEKKSLRRKSNAAPKTNEKSKRKKK